MFIPYTYLIGWSQLNLFYYGVECSNNTRKIANPNNLWKIYFTSSKQVKRVRTQYGEPDIIQIRKTFTTYEQAKAWEHKVLRRINAKDNVKFINKSNSNSHLGSQKGENNGMFNRTHSEKTRKQLSETRKKLFQEGKIKGPVEGKGHNDKTKELLSQKAKERFKTEKGTFTGKTHSVEAKEKNRLAHLGKSYPKSLEEKKLISDRFTNSIFINNEIINKRIKENAFPIFQSQGWKRGKIKISNCRAR